MNSEKTKEVCKEIRKSIIKISCEKKTAHVGSALSIVEILVTLYFEVLNIDPVNPRAPDRDIFILSKGHASIALYNVLTMAGFFPKERLASYCQLKSGMGVHSDQHVLPGIEICSGSLGHGLSIGIGMAIASKRDKKDNRIVVLMGDGEVNEGSVWEAAMAASHYRLDNLVAVIDRNCLQADSRTEEAMALEPLEKKWESFGWNVESVGGHNLLKLSRIFKKMYRVSEPDKPNLVIARTVKGKGVSFMENKQAWHFNIPSEEEVKRALEEFM